MSLLRSRPLAASTLSPVEYADTRGRLPRRLGVAAVACLLMIQLTGCAPGEEEPQQLASGESTTTAPEPTPEPETPETPQDPPQEPAAMANNNDEGAIAATKYFLTLIEYHTKNNSLEEIDNYFYSDCKYCREMLDAETERNLLKWEFTSFSMTPTSDFEIIQHEGVVWSVTSKVDMTAKLQQHASGEEEDRSSLLQWTFHLGKIDSEWKIFEIEGKA
ncbi:DUF6318 family protein [Jonesia quinghaiensis]|uniref:DUF6318 family protein n=1 Tax=Jonesia quinghaiensis TaxID=262806 RepID=UPI0012FBA434|nr:DUF6318 family protein [Jonesia quinghaiensis]